MDSIAGLQRGHAQRHTPPQLYRGEVQDVNPSSGIATVVVPALSRRALRHSPYQTGINPPPSPGDTCWVIESNERQLVIVAWQGAQAEGMGPTGPAGGVLSGEYPNPEFAEPMVTALELDVLARLAVRNVDANHTIVDGDHSNMVRTTGVGAITVHLPAGLRPGFYCSVLKGGSGEVTVTVDPTLTLQSEGGMRKVGPQWRQAQIAHLGGAEYVLDGAIQA